MNCSFHFQSWCTTEFELGLFPLLSGFHPQWDADAMCTGRLISLHSVTATSPRRTADLIRRRNLPWWKACVPFPALGCNELGGVPPSASVRQISAPLPTFSQGKISYKNPSEQPRKEKRKINRGRELIFVLNPLPPLFKTLQIRLASF